MDWEQFFAELQGRGFFFFSFNKDKLGSQSYREKCDHSCAKRGEIILITLELGLLTLTSWIKGVTRKKD